jgi:acyl-CoA dehydrogenase
VLDGHVADAFVVTARDGDGLSLLVVPARSKGVTVSRRITVDGRNVATVRFEGVTGSVLGEPGRAGGVIDRVLDRGTIALTAEMLGGAREAFDRTVQYLKDRKQFGVPIGSFQALKHRAAHLFCELELLTSVVLHALRSDEAADRAQIACVAKARATDTFLLAANEGVQMHGGIGVTDDHDIGLFLKRARVCEMTFGGAAYQRDRFATLGGYLRSALTPGPSPPRGEGGCATRAGSFHEIGYPPSSPLPSGERGRG